MLGMSDGYVPSFVRQYVKLAETILEATGAYVNDVRTGRFPETHVRAEATPIA
jgi:ketopantoate hydroxymethyltransferase